MLLSATECHFRSAPSHDRHSASLSDCPPNHLIAFLITTGIRRAAAGGEEREELDRMAVARAKQMIMSCHVSLLLFDAKLGLTRNDLQIADLVIENNKSCVLVANKARY